MEALPRDLATLTPTEGANDLMLLSLVDTLAKE
jgi:hypothetical protein